MSDLTNDLVTQIRDTAAAGGRLTIEGGASKRWYGNPVQNGAVLRTTGHTGIVDYDPAELVLTARAGTPLAELEQVLADRGQMLAFEPPRHSVNGVSGATLGGAVATALSGPGRPFTGGVRDFVLGLHVIDGKGDVLKFGGQVMKNVAGYDVSRVLAGSMGCLGVVTEVSLKVLPQAPAEATLVCHLNQAQALEQLHRWGAQALPLNASAWLHDTHCQPATDCLFVRLRGAAAAVEAACPRMVADVQALGGTAYRMDNAQAARDWQAGREQTLPFFTAPAPDLCLWRLSLPQTAPVLDVPYAVYVEWHGGLRWLWAPASAAHRLRQAAHAAGGHATLFRRPAGAEVSVPVFSPLSDVQQRIQRELQHQFDPHGVFNTGRLGI